MNTVAMALAPASVFYEKSNEERPILVEGNSHVKTVVLNRPQKLNALSHQMILKLLKEFKRFEMDPDIKLVIIKGSGRAFCAGGDAAGIIRCCIEGHWSFGARFYRKQFTLDHTVATYKKPQVFLINGPVMGGGAGLSMNGRFRVVTEKSVFAMPEAAIGLFPDVGASYFLSRLPGFFGEYLGLTGAKLDGAEMLACGLATHYVPSKNLLLLEESLYAADTNDPTAIQRIINKFETQARLKKESAYRRLDIINKCFAKQSVEEILSSLEHEAAEAKDEWIFAAIKSIKMASPTSLKLFLLSIRRGRKQDINECLVQEYRMVSHAMRKTVCKDLYEGARAKFFDKDNSPKWEPSRLELVSDIMLQEYSTKLDEDEDWQDLNLPPRTNLTSLHPARL